MVGLNTISITILTIITMIDKLLSQKNLLGIIILLTADDWIHRFPRKKPSKNRVPTVGRPEAINPRAYRPATETGRHNTEIETKSTIELMM